MPVIRAKDLCDNRIEAIKNYHLRVGIERAEIDVSGGIDSAVTFSLLVRALGADKVTAVFIGIHSSADSLRRARAVAEKLSARLIVDELGHEFDQRLANMLAHLADAGYERAALERRIAEDPTILGSIRSCLRAPIGRGYNRLTGGGVRHGTGNECEDRFIRFYQKGGDGEVDTNPIAMLAKGEVYQLARQLGVPKMILEAVPSPDLWAVGEGHTDEQELLSYAGVPWTYSRVDPDTGAYTSVGSIERMSRYLDDIDDALFETEADVAALLHGSGELAAAETHPAFKGLAVEQIEQFLRSAQRIEKLTRHKANPNIPTLGERQQLLAAGILSNGLPTC